MTDRKRRFFSGPSLEAALVGAASEYGIPPEEVSYRVVEKRHGFLKIRRNTVIEVDPDAPRKSGDEAPEVVARQPPAQAAATTTRASDPGGGSGEEAKVFKESTEEPTEEPEEGASREEAPPTVGAERPPLRPRSREAVEEGAPRASEGRRLPEKAREAGEERKAGGRRRGRRREETERGDREEGAGRDVKRAGSGRRRPRLEPPKPIEQRLKKARGEKAEAALEATEWLLDLVDLDVDPEVYQGEDRFEVELRGRDRERLVPDNGKVLSALEHLIPRVMRGVCGDTHPVRVDSENYQALREDRLRELAWDSADKVRREGQATILEAMDPADRRIVHIAVSDDPEVTTRSLGEGFFKRVKVLPR